MLNWFQKRSLTVLNGLNFLLIFEELKSGYKNFVLHKESEGL